jgi:hypothetical protein
MFSGVPPATDIRHRGLSTCSDIVYRLDCPVLMLWTGAPRRAVGIFSGDGAWRSSPQSRRSLPIGGVIAPMLPLDQKLRRKASSWTNFGSPPHGEDRARSWKLAVCAAPTSPFPILKCDATKVVLGRTVTCNVLELARRGGHPVGEAIALHVTEIDTPPCPPLGRLSRLVRASPLCRPMSSGSSPTDCCRSEGDVGGAGHQAERRARSANGWF